MVTQAKIDFYLFIYLTGSLKAGDPTVGLEGPICHQGSGSFQRFTLLLSYVVFDPGPLSHGCQKTIHFQASYSHKKHPKQKRGER